MSLRARLLVSVLVLVAAALIVAATAIYAEQRSYLYSRLDKTAVAAAAPIAYALGVDARLLSGNVKERHRTGVGRAEAPPEGRGLAGFVPSGTFGEFVDTNGRLLRGPIVASYGERPPPRPAIPARVLRAQSSGSLGLYTVGSMPKSKIRFRVALVPLESGAGAVAVAVPQRDVDQTLDRLVVVEALVVAGVLVVLVGLGWTVIRLALRPLDQMSRVANGISEGDLSGRVSPATPHTEIGRLGLSLNRMLVRIEEAFADRARSEERRRQFVADASHELRTPLAAIRGYAELFRLGPARDSEALERAMARIESEATRMGVLVEDLLALARLDELPESRSVSVDITDLASQAVADARATAPTRAVVLHGTDGLMVLGDPDGLHQVLANLMGNALIHTPDGSPIELAVHRDGPDAVIEVIDHGPGLPPGAEEHVFERFWRADGARTRGAGGSGLGLSIVREIVNAHHGSVRAQNRDGGGAQFTIRLPVAAPQSPSSEARGAPSPRARVLS